MDAYWKEVDYSSKNFSTAVAMLLIVLTLQILYLRVPSLLT